MEVKVYLRYLNIAPRKTRLVANLIKGMEVERAKAQLLFCKKRAAKPILKLINSAIANARNNLEIDGNFFIKEIRVDQGPMLKRWMPRAFGRATMIQRKTSHITLILEVKEPKKVERKAIKNEEKKEGARKEEVETEKTKKETVRKEISEIEVKKPGKKLKVPKILPGVKKMFKNRGGER
ncbi:50S ribosomal protein L22 [bacterium]|nr:50S ribosomal protein L22 [bacterium]